MSKFDDKISSIAKQMDWPRRSLDSLLCEMHKALSETDWHSNEYLEVIKIYGTISRARNQQAELIESLKKSIGEV